VLITSLTLAASFKHSPAHQAFDLGQGNGDVVNLLVVDSAKAASAYDRPECSPAAEEIEDWGGQILQALAQDADVPRSLYESIPKFLGGRTMKDVICEALEIADKTGGYTSFNVSNTMIRLRISSALTEKEVANADVIFMTRDMQDSMNLAAVSNRRKGTALLLIDRSGSESVEGVGESSAIGLAKTTLNGTAAHMLKMHPLFGHGGIHTIRNIQDAGVAGVFAIIFYNPVMMAVSCSKTWSQGDSFLECPKDELEHCLKCPHWAGCHRC
jgi:hypothetical protein